MQVSLLIGIDLGDVLPTEPGCWKNIVNLASATTWCQNHISGGWVRDFDSCPNNENCETFTEPGCIQDAANADCVSFHEEACLARAAEEDDHCQVTGTLVRFNPVDVSALADYERISIGQCIDSYETHSDDLTFQECAEHCTTIGCQYFSRPLNAGLFEAAACSTTIDGIIQGTCDEAVYAELEYRVATQPGIDADCWTGYAHITDDADCEIAATAINGDGDWQHTSFRPGRRGCYHFSSNGQHSNGQYDNGVYFASTDEAGSTTGDYTYKICKKTEVNCGTQYATSCADCSQGNSDAGCSGECIWLYDYCVARSSVTDCTDISGVWDMAILSQIVCGGTTSTGQWNYIISGNDITVYNRLGRTETSGIVNADNTQIIWSNGHIFNRPDLEYYCANGRDSIEQDAVIASPNPGNFETQGSWVIVPSQTECQKLCTDHSQCVSYKFWPDDEQRLCALLRYSSSIAHANEELQFCTAQVLPWTCTKELNSISDISSVGQRNYDLANGAPMETCKSVCADEITNCILFWQQKHESTYVCAFYDQVGTKYLHEHSNGDPLMCSMEEFPKFVVVQSSYDCRPGYVHIQDYALCEQALLFLGKKHKPINEGNDPNDPLGCWLHWEVHGEVGDYHHAYFNSGGTLNGARSGRSAVCALAYSRVDAGSTCEENGFSTIGNEPLCEESANSLGVNYNTGISANNEPFGCFYRTADDDVMFNWKIDSTTLYSGRTDRQAICGKESTVQWTIIGTGDCMVSSGVRAYKTGYSWIGVTSDCRQECLSDVNCVAYQQSGEQHGYGGEGNCVIFDVMPTLTENEFDGWEISNCYVSQLRDPMDGLCEFVQGDGIGGSEIDTLQSLTGQDCAQHCLQIGGYNGATIRSNGEPGCWCEDGMTGSDGSSEYMTCFLTQSDDPCLDDDYACENYLECCANHGYLQTGHGPICERVQAFHKTGICHALNAVPSTVPSQSLSQIPSRSPTEPPTRAPTHGCAADPERLYDISLNFNAVYDIGFRNDWVKTNTRQDCAQACCEAEDCFLWTYVHQTYVFNELWQGMCCFLSENEAALHVRDCPTDWRFEEHIDTGISKTTAATHSDLWMLHRNDGHCSYPRQSMLINGRSENYETVPFTLEYCKSECESLRGRAVSYRAVDGWCRCEDQLSIPDSPQIENGWECWITSDYCDNLWELYVDKSMPVEVSLTQAYNQFFTHSELSALSSAVDVGSSMYRMIYTVSSTCSTSVDLGMAMSGGWLIVTVPPNANQIQLEVSGQWADVEELRLENRHSCPGQRMTIHDVVLVNDNCPSLEHINTCSRQSCYNNPSLCTTNDELCSEICEPQHGVQYRVDHSDNSFSGIYDDSHGDEWNGYPIYRMQRNSSLLIYLNLDTAFEWVLDSHEPSPGDLAGGHARGVGVSPDQVSSWDPHMSVILLHNTTCNDGHDENYSCDDYPRFGCCNGFELKGFTKDNMKCVPSWDDTYPFSCECSVYIFGSTSGPHSFSVPSDTGYIYPFAIESVAACSIWDLKCDITSTSRSCDSSRMLRVIDANGKFVHAETTDGMLWCDNQQTNIVPMCYEVGCQMHSDCDIGEFCDALNSCHPCSACHSCSDGVDDTCGECGFPISQSGGCNKVAFFCDCEYRNCRGTESSHRSECTQHWAEHICVEIDGCKWFGDVIESMDDDSLNARIAAECSAFLRSNPGNPSPLCPSHDNPDTVSCNDIVVPESCREIERKLCPCQCGRCTFLPEDFRYKWQDDALPPHSTSETELCTGDAVNATLNAALMFCHLEDCAGIEPWDCTFECFGWRVLKQLSSRTCPIMHIKDSDRCQCNLFALYEQVQNEPKVFDGCTSQCISGLDFFQECRTNPLGDGCFECSCKDMSAQDLVLRYCTERCTSGAMCLSYDIRSRDYECHMTEASMCTGLWCGEILESLNNITINLTNDAVEVPAFHTTLHYLGFEFGDDTYYICIEREIYRGDDTSQGLCNILTGTNDSYIVEAGKFTLLGGRDFLMRLHNCSRDAMDFSRDCYHDMFHSSCDEHDAINIQCSATFPPTHFPTVDPTFSPSGGPTLKPTNEPTCNPTVNPTFSPSGSPTLKPTDEPTCNPTFTPTSCPYRIPTAHPNINPSCEPTRIPTIGPTSSPLPPSTARPSPVPSLAPSPASASSKTLMSQLSQTNWLLMVGIIALGSLVLCCVVVVCCRYYHPRKAEESKTKGRDSEREFRINISRQSTWGMKNLYAQIPGRASSFFGGTYASIELMHSKKSIVELKKQVSTTPSMLSFSASESNKFAPGRELPTIPWNHLKVTKFLGEGSFGQVYKATWQGHDVAVKTLKGGKMKRDEFFEEAHFMNSVPHPNILQLWGVVEEKKHCAIVTEFMSEGSLEDVLRKIRDGDRVAFKEEQRLNILRQCASGLIALHQREIIHRDLSARNILLNHNCTHAVISDFGMSRRMAFKDETDSFSKTVNMIGPVLWYAPESLTHNVYSTKSDIWSFGVMMWEVYALKQPYEGEPMMRVIAEIISSQRRLPIEPDWVAAALMTKCWKEKAENRPTIEEIANELADLELECMRQCYGEEICQAGNTLPEGIDAEGDSETTSGGTIIEESEVVIEALKSGSECGSPRYANRKSMHL